LVEDSGVQLVVDADGGKEKALSNPLIRKAFTVRQRFVGRLLDLTLLFNKQYAQAYAGVPVDKAALAKLPHNGVPDTVPIFEQRGAANVELADLCVSTTAVLRWLQEGDEDPAAYPIGSAAFVRWSECYDLHEEAIGADIQKAPRSAPRTDMIRLPDLASYLGETGVLRQVFQSGECESLPSRRREDALKPALKFKSKDEQKAFESKARAQERANNEEWKVVDARLVQEFENLGSTLYREDMTCVPAGFGRKLTVAETNDEKVGELLQDDARVSGAQETEKKRAKSDPFERPAPGKAIDERTEGFYPLCYPHLFVFGLGCFNQKRQVEVSWKEWAEWCLFQDHAMLLGEPCSSRPPLFATSEEQIKDALQHGLAVVYQRSHKTPGTKSGRRFEIYKVAATFQEALSLGATMSDLTYDFQNGIVEIQNTAPSPIIVGSGSMRHMTDKLFSFHIMNTHFRDIAHTSSRAFVRHICGRGNLDPSRLAEVLATADSRDLQRQLLSFTRSMPNSPQYFDSKRRELLCMIEECGQPTFFVTHSAADTHCPHLHRLIVQWNGFADTNRDPFVPNLSPSKAHKRRCQNLQDSPAIAAWFWNKKTALFRDKIMPLLGFTAYWERTEFQCRGSAHGHCLWWHPLAPSDYFLDELCGFAMAIARDQGADDGTDLDGAFAAEIATGLASRSPSLFVYSPDGSLCLDSDGCPEPNEELRVLLSRAIDEEMPPDPELSQETTRTPLERGIDPALVITCINKAAAGAAWYGAMLDSANALFDAEAGALRYNDLDLTHPSQTNPVEIARSKLGWESSDDATADLGDLQVHDARFEQLRAYTGRHTECSSSHCLRKRPVKSGADAKFPGGAAQPQEPPQTSSAKGSSVETAKRPSSKPDTEQYCRFEDGLKIRDFPVERFPGSGLTAPSHYYAEEAEIMDGRTLLRWRFYVGDKTDPRMNSCFVPHERSFMSNCDGKACLDKYGLVNYVCKVAGYVTKAEKSSKQFRDLLSTAFGALEPGGAMNAPFRTALFNIIDRK
jgi:hypothetical protein